MMTPFTPERDCTIEYIGVDGERIFLDEPYPVKAGTWYAADVDLWPEPYAYVIELGAKDRAEALLRCGLVEIPVARRQVSDDA